VEDSALGPLFDRLTAQSSTLVIVTGDRRETSAARLPHVFTVVDAARAAHRL
jgi:hypothetical protein